MCPNAIGPKTLHEAAFEGDAETLLCLLEAGAAIDAVSADSGDTPLMLAIENLQEDGVRILLDRGADPNLPGYGGTTPLQAAIDVAVEDWKRNFDSTGVLLPASTTCLELLLRAGADPLKVDGNGKSAVAWAKGHQHLQAIALLEKHSK